MANAPVTLVMNCYRQEAYVAEALRAALAQDWQPLEIIVSDDASPDGTWDVIEEVVAGYRGPHAVVTNRNAENLRSEHVEKLVRMARGDFVVVAHGDDVSLPHRVTRLARTWKQRGASLITSNATQIDADGNVSGLYHPKGATGPLSLLDIAGGPWREEMLGASMSFDRRIYGEPFVPITRDLVSSGRDHVLPLRAALLGGFYYLAEPLLLYRRHHQQASTRIADWTQGPTVWEETQRAHNLTLRIHMLRELVRFKKHAPRPELEAAQEALIGHLVDEVHGWSLVRNALLASDLRPTWIDKAELDARPLTAVRGD